MAMILTRKKILVFLQVRIGQNNVTAYTYKYRLLTTISHHGFGFEYEYDGYGRRTAVKVSGDDTNYLTSTYVDNYIDTLLGIQYGSKVTLAYKNGLVVESYTDEKGLIKQTKCDAVITKYTYDSKD